LKLKLTVIESIMRLTIEYYLYRKW